MSTNLFSHIFTRGYLPLPNFTVILRSLRELSPSESGLLLFSILLILLSGTLLWLYRRDGLRKIIACLALLSATIWFCAFQTVLGPVIFASVNAITISGVLQVDQKCNTSGVYDGSCFSNAFAAATAGQKLFVSAHTYSLTGSGADIIHQTLPLSIECDPSAVLQVANSVPNTTDIWHWIANAAQGPWQIRNCHTASILGSPQTVTAASNATPIQISITAHGYVTGNVVKCGSILGNTDANGTYVITRVDANNFTLNGSAGNAAYTSGGTCSLVPGGYSLHVDSTNGNQIAGFTIQDDSFDQTGKPALFFDNTGSSQDGIFTGVVLHNTLKGGFTSARMGDSIAFRDNVLTGGFDGFLIDVVQNGTQGGGAHESAWENNNVTSQGCSFRITNGSYLYFRGNNAEESATGANGGPDLTNCPNNATFDIDCNSTNLCTGIEAQRNTVSAFAASSSVGPQNVFRCNWCRAFYGHHNNAELAFAGQKEYVFTANSRLNRAWINVNGLESTCASRVTDAGTRNNIWCDNQADGAFEIGSINSPDNHFYMRAGTAQVAGDQFGIFTNGGTGILEATGTGHVIVGGGADNGNIFQVTGASTFAGNIRSNVAGSSTLGSSSFPWNSLFLGTNGFSFQFNGTATANRVISLGDVGGTLPIIIGTATTAGIGGGALGAGACASTTTAITGSLTTQQVLTTPNTYPGDGTWWESYVSAGGTVTTKICTAIAQTPTSSSYVIKVIGP